MNAPGTLDREATLQLIRAELTVQKRIMDSAYTEERKRRLDGEPATENGRIEYARWVGMGVLARAIGYSPLELDGR